ncbi:hypothetical protein [Glutamicibacter sp. PS]|uniref:hypothetical protein n=1 Tax=Glutamicibacter sp. PS TaxID=3075634 RepID=UPI0028522B63|nr:hypothetical protein [Glutamicibacter sp. PS]MDR4533057.1 hypothetical protein [Glutamicibacter sp. PS]
MHQPTNRAVLLVRKAPSAASLMRLHRLLKIGLSEIASRIDRNDPLLDVELFGNDHIEVSQQVRAVLAEFDGADVAVHLCLENESPSPHNEWTVEVLLNILQASHELRE